MLRPVLAIPVCALLLAGCGAFQKEESRSCPEIRIDATTASLTRFQPGQGRDITDVVLSGDVTGFDGNCQYDKDTVVVTLYPSFTLELGPAATDRTQSVEYFVAVPSYFPSPQAKQVFRTMVPFPANLNRLGFRGDEIAISLPLENDQATAAHQQVYLGFQLTPEQLEYNRENR